MSNFLSQLTRSEQARLLAELNYMNLTALPGARLGCRWGCSRERSWPCTHAGLGRFDEAEQLARDVSFLFPGAIDASGAPLDDLLEGVRLLRYR